MSLKKMNKIASLHEKFTQTGKFDPDMDGDDDSTPEGDTDHDVFPEKKPKSKQQMAAMKAKDKGEKLPNKKLK